MEETSEKVGIAYGLDGKRELAVCIQPRIHVLVVIQFCSELIISAGCCKIASLQYYSHLSVKNCDGF